MKLTKSEMEIMEVLWKNGPLTRTGILEHSKERTWKESSIHILLNGMLRKGVIEIAGFEKMGSHYGRTYAAALTEPEYAAQQVQAMVKGQKHKEDTVKAIICTLLKEDALSSDTLQEIEKVLQDMRKR